MGSVVAIPEQRTLLHDVSWETYEHRSPITATSHRLVSPSTEGGWR